jgi:hypothetical protein
MEESSPVIAVILGKPRSEAPQRDDVQQDEGGVPLFMTRIFMFTRSPPLRKRSSGRGRTSYYSAWGCSGKKCVLSFIRMLHASLSAGGERVLPRKRQHGLFLGFVFLFG